MNCLEFKAKLQSAVESRELPDGDELAAHMRHCPACLREWNDHQLLTQAVAAWKDASPGVDLTDSILSRWLLETTGPVHFRPLPIDAADEEPKEASADRVVLAPEPSSPDRRAIDRFRARQVFWIPGGLVVIFFVLIWQGGSPRENSSVSIAPTRNGKARSTAQPPVPPLDTLLQDVESGYWELAHSAVSTVSDAADLLPMRRGGTSGNLPFWTGLPSAPITETLNSTQSEGKHPSPFSQGFSKALDLLLEVVPTTELPTS